MTEIRIRVNNEILDEMDRLVNGRDLRGRRWLKDAVAIYKEILAERLRQSETEASIRARRRRPARRQSLREVLQAGRSAALRLLGDPDSSHAAAAR